MKSLAKRPAPALSRVGRAALDRVFRLVRERLTEVERMVAAQIDGFDPQVRPYVAYATARGGKRLRPALALLAAGATGDTGERHVRLATIVELVHVATLVHDDIMDGAEVRRSQESANARWGESLSVLLGDCLFAHAMMLSAEYPEREVSRLLAEAVRTVCSGEILQTQRRFDPALDPAEYSRIIEMKTGALFAVASQLAAILNGASPAIADALRDYGLKLGSAYQIYDDCVDLAGDEDSVGKSLGTDLRKGKLTLPLLTLLRDAAPDLRRHLEERIAQPTEEDCRALTSMAIESGALRRSVEAATSLLDQARHRIEPLAPSPHRDALHQLALSLAELLGTLPK